LAGYALKKQREFGTSVNCSGVADFCEYSNEFKAIALTQPAELPDLG
jgi:hypothetical protein